MIQNDINILKQFHEQNKFRDGGKLQEATNRIIKEAEEYQKYKSNWQRMRETVFAIMHYTNEIRADEFLKYMEELEEVKEIEEENE